MFMIAEPPALCLGGTALNSDTAVLWRSGSFVCELRTDPACLAFLSVLKDGEPVLEVPVLSALDAQERAINFRTLVEQARSSDVAHVRDLPI